MKYTKKRLLFPESKIIVFFNFKKFLSARKRPWVQPLLNEYWNTVRDISWPEHPPTTPKEFYNLDIRIQEELLNFFNGNIFNFLDYTFEDYTRWDEYDYADAEVFFFDVDLSYSHKDIFYNHYIDVCNFLHLPPADKKLVDNYFCEWLQTIDNLKFV